MDEPLIVQVIQHYHPDWEPPKDTGREWHKCLCAWHGDGTASAAVSYKHDAFGCLGCPVKGSAITLIMLLEGVSYSAAIKFAKEISPGSDIPLPRKSRGKSRRRLSEDQGFVPGERSGQEIPVGIRGRRTPWSGNV